MTVQVSAQISIQSFILKCKESIANELFVKIKMGAYQGEIVQLKAIEIKLVELKKGVHLSFTYKYKTRDEVKNFSKEDGIEKIQKYIEQGMRFSRLFTLNEDIVLEYLANGKLVTNTHKPTITEAPLLSHDHKKKRLIKSNSKPYLQSLGVCDKEGNVLKNSQDKFRQINHYVDVLRPLFESLALNEKLNIVDMGSGKGYLTFALFDYLMNVLQRDVSMAGVEIRPDLVKLCNQIALENDFKKLKFVEGSIHGFEEDNYNVIIALHACDTATDDAIFKGIEREASLIVVAPCCHKQIRREMANSEHDSRLSPILKHGIFMERQAEMITDTLRALYLELAGYKTKVFEFVSDVHTPKNIMITAIKRKQSLIQKQKIRNEIADLKAIFGIKKHYLETLLHLE